MNHKDGIKIQVPKEFRLSANVDYMLRSKNECMYDIMEGKVLKAIPIGVSHRLIEISEERNGELLLRFLNHAQHSIQDDRKAIEYVQEWFDLKTNLAPFYTLAKKDPLLKQVVDQCYGLRILGIHDLFEALCWAILGQQINLTFAYTLKRRLVESYGRSIEWEGRLFWIFPEPEDIACLKVDDLFKLKISRKKCEYLIDVARLVSDGKLTKQSLLETNDIEEAEKRLVHIRGIGPWTANYVLMRCLRFTSAFPIDDVGLHNAIKYLKRSEQKPTKEEIKMYASNWKNWEAYATFYLWRATY